MPPSCEQVRAGLCECQIPASGNGATTAMIYPEIDCRYPRYVIEA
jgi:hypothetical protein